MSKSLSVTVIATLAIFLVFVLPLPGFKTWQLLGQEIGIRQNALNEKQVTLERIRNLEKIFKENGDMFAKLDNIVPQTNQLPEIISALSTIAGQSGLAIESLGFTQASPQTEMHARILRITGKFSGNYEAYRNFAALLEQNTRLFDVIESTITRPQAGSEFLNISILLQAYALKL